MTIDDQALTRLGLMHHLTEPAMRSIIKQAGFPRGSRGLDAGCGGGHRTRLLAENLGPAGELVALDVEPAHLEAARALLAGDDAAARADVNMVKGDIARLPFPDRSFDWVWCADTLWPGLSTTDPVRSVRELARVIRPGGTLLLAYWSHQLLFPGHAELEAKLAAAFAATTPYMTGVPPEAAFLRASSWLQAAGLTAVRAFSSLAEIASPLTPHTRTALRAAFSMLWDGVRDGLRPDERELLDRICRDGEDGIVRAPGYYGLIVYTSFAGAVPHQD